MNNSNHSTSAILERIGQLLGERSARTGYVFRNAERFRQGPVPRNAARYDRNERNLMTVCKTMIADAKMYDDVKYAAMGYPASGMSGALTQDEVDAYEQLQGLPAVKVVHTELDYAADEVDDMSDMPISVVRGMIATSILIDEYERIEARMGLGDAPTVEVAADKQTGRMSFQVNGEEYGTFIEAINAATSK